MSERARPYLKLGIEEFEALFVARRDDFRIVDDIHCELMIRTTPRAGRLREEAEVALQQLTAAAEPTSGRAQDMPEDEADDGAGDDVDIVGDEPDEDAANLEDTSAISDVDDPFKELAQAQSDWRRAVNRALHSDQVRLAVAAQPSKPVNQRRRASTFGDRTKPLPR